MLNSNKNLIIIFFWNICYDRIRFDVFVCLRRKVSETLHELRCLYFSSKAILQLSQSVRGHFVTLIEVRMHIISQNRFPRDVMAAMLVYRTISQYQKYHNTLCLLPPSPLLKFCISIVFIFSWDLQRSQEKLETVLMQSFLDGQTKSIMVLLIKTVF